jgi:hypothetical protein
MNLRLPRNSSTSCMPSGSQTRRRQCSCCSCSLLCYGFSVGTHVPRCRLCVRCRPLPTTPGRHSPDRPNISGPTIRLENTDYVLSRSIPNRHGIHLQDTARVVTTAIYEYVSYAAVVCTGINQPGSRKSDCPAFAPSPLTFLPSGMSSTPTSPYLEVPRTAVDPYGTTNYSTPLATSYSTPLGSPIALPPYSAPQEHAYAYGMPTGYQGFVANPIWT